MELVEFNDLFLKEDLNIKKLLNDIRQEITDAIFSAKINKSFDRDISLSFGMIHINPYGSISEISFNGLDVTDIDKFVVEQALHIKKENYFDICFYVRDNATKFSFFPITDGKKVYYTLLKDSEYFKEKFGDIIHDHEHFRIQYTFKYIVISVFKNDWESYVFKVEPYDSAHLADILTRDAIRQSGLHSMLYYCFSNTKPETLVKIGRIKKDFYAYKAAASYGYFKFYKGNLDNLILRLYKVCNSKNEPVVKETRRRYAEKIIKDCYYGLKDFCFQKNLNEKSVRDYITRKSNNLRHDNDDNVTFNRLDELLNLSEHINENSLKNSNLLIEVKFDDIPEDHYAD